MRSPPRGVGLAAMPRGFRRGGDRSDAWGVARGWAKGYEPEGLARAVPAGTRPGVGLRGAAWRCSVLARAFLRRSCAAALLDHPTLCYRGQTHPPGPGLAHCLLYRAP